jgi:two-component system, sensor histidine kinase LadS
MKKTTRLLTSLVFLWTVLFGATSLALAMPVTPLFKDQLTCLCGTAEYTLVPSTSDSFDKVKLLPEDSWQTLPSVGTVNTKNRVAWIRTRVRASPDLAYESIAFFSNNLGAQKVEYFAPDVGVGPFALKDSFCLKTQLEMPVYLRVESLFPLSTNWQVGVAARVFEKAHRQQSLNFFYCGFVLALCAMSAFVFFLLKRPAYAAYVLYGFVSSLSLMVMTRNLNWLWEESHLPTLGSFFEWSTAISIWTIALAINFMAVYLDLKTVHPRLNLFLRSLKLFLLSLGILAFVPGFLEYTFDLIQIVMAFVFVIVIGTGVVTLRKKVEGAGVFLFAWSAQVTAVCVWLGAQNGHIPMSFWTANSASFGQLLESLVFGAALVQDFRKQDRLKYAALERDELKTLVRILTHDVATPLQVVLLHADRKLEKQPDDKSMLRIQKAAESVREIVDYVRQLQGLRDGKLGAKLEEVELEPLLHELNDLLQERLTSKKVDLQLPSLSGLQGAKVVAERITLKVQVLLNLLTNAIKFSHPGGVVQVSTEVRHNLVKIHIKDFGIGIPAESLATLFDFQFSSSRDGTLGEKGTGYGMPIAKLYVESFGGSLEVESRVADEVGNPAPYSASNSTILNPEDPEHPEVSPGTCFTITLKRAS